MLSALGFHTYHIFVKHIFSHRGPQGVDKPHKTPFWGISWPLTSSKKIFFCRILKSAYRSNETFFSRTHSFGCGDQVCSGGGYREVQGRLLISLRVNVLIWWTDVPRGSVGGRGGSRVDATLDPRRRDWYIKNDINLMCSCFEEIPLKTTEIHILVTRCNTYRDSHEKHPSISVSPKLPPNSCQGSTRDTNRLTTRPPTPFIEPPRHEKVNFHRLIELNLIDPEKILEFCIL